MKKLIFLFFLLHLIHLNQSRQTSEFTLNKANEQIIDKQRCTTLSCVSAGASVLQKLDLDVKPCDDFYEFACGAYIAEKHTPDEKATIDTRGTMYQQLIQYLLRVFEHSSESKTSKEIHGYAQNFYDSCMDTSIINEIGLDPLKEMLKSVGGWPLLEGKNWNEENFIGWENLINAFRKYVNNDQENIFNTKRSARDYDDDEKLQAFNDEEEKSINKIDEQLEMFLNALVISMDGVDDTNDIQNLVEFERKVAVYQLKFKIFKKKFPKSKSVLPELKKYHKYLLYLDILEHSLYTTAIKVKDDEVTEDFNQIYADFIKNTPNRTISNFIIWRFVQASMAFLDKDSRNFVLNFRKNANGNEDNEQRWIYCIDLIIHIAPVAAGSIYIDGYFSTEDKAAADEIIDYFVRVYKETVENADWIDSKTRMATVKAASEMHHFVGYHPNMRKQEGYNIYNKLPIYTDHADFMKTGLTFILFKTDREFLGRLNPTRKPGSLDSDWTKYAQPASLNAYYSRKDNSLQFPAAILQTPLFDKDRPPFMNFAALGAIIGHELTHSFDNKKEQFQTWDDKLIKCIVDQYSSIRVSKIERVHLNGTTKDEDIADNGGLKLAYKAWQLYLDEHEEAKIRPIGLDTIDNSKAFWISYAQTFCSVERREDLLNTRYRSLDRYRANVPLMNSIEFSEAWNCPIGSPMNPKHKCTVW